MNNLTGLFDDLNDTKIQDYKKKISASIQKFITRLSELINQNNTLLKSQKETEAKLTLNEDDKKKLLTELDKKNKELESYKIDSFKQIENITNTIKILEHNIEETNKKTILLTNEKKLIEDKLSLITNEKKTLENEIENLKKDNSLKIEQIKVLQDKIQIFEEKSKLDNNTKNECEDLKKQLENKNKILEERKLLIDLCNDKTKLFEKQIERLKSVTDELDNDLNEKIEPEIFQQSQSLENMTSELLIKKIEEEYKKLHTVLKGTDGKVSEEYDNNIQEILKPNNNTLILKEKLKILVSQIENSEICKQDKISNEKGNVEYCNLGNLFKKLNKVLDKV